MTPEAKLAQIAVSLKSAGIDALVMGGHAVRYYGVDRNTADFDMVTSITTPEELTARLRETELFQKAVALPVWRSKDFARFEIGTLPDGRQELMEFWLRNHLLSDYDAMKSRAELGEYGGAHVSFISLDDLLKSKETEREGDWQDIALLEEIRDARLPAAATDLGRIVTALSEVRSRRGFDRLQTCGILDDKAAVAAAIEQCVHPVTFAFLSPLCPDIRPAKLPGPIDPAALQALGRVTFNSALHLGVVEIFLRLSAKCRHDHFRNRP